jgi:ribosomal protein S18 acetylase RimI-like enzyme
MERLTEKTSNSNSLLMPYSFRFANENDIPFLVESIIAAEKSGTTLCGLSNLLGLDEEQTAIGLNKILREEIEGCEFSTTEFAVATSDGIPVAAFCGWIEGDNEDNQPSALLKSNLLIHGFGTSIIPHLQNQKDLLTAIQLGRTPGTHQVEYAFVHEEHRGKKLIDQLIHFLLAHAKNKKPDLQFAQVQVYANNTRAIDVYKRMGYEPFQKAVYSPEMNGQILPYHEKWTLQKNLNQ